MGAWHAVEASTVHVVGFAAAAVGEFRFLIGTRRVSHILPRQGVLGLAGEQRLGIAALACQRRAGDERVAGTGVPAAVVVRALRIGFILVAVGEENDLPGTQVEVVLRKHVDINVAAAGKGLNLRKR